MEMRKKKTVSKLCRNLFEAIPKTNITMGIQNLTLKGYFYKK